MSRSVLLIFLTTRIRSCVSFKVLILVVVIYKIPKRIILIRFVDFV